MKIRSASPRLTLNARGAKGLPLPHRHRDTNSVAEFHTPLCRAFLDCDPDSTPRQCEMSVVGETASALRSLTALLRRAHGINRLPQAG